MNSSNISYPSFSSLDLYYLSIVSNIFLYGYIIIMIIGFTGNIFQIITFSHKTMRKISTGILFLALSISDTVYLLLSLYILIIYGFNIPDQSNYPKLCQFRHYIHYLATNFSAWMLTTNDGRPSFYLFDNGSNFADFHHRNSRLTKRATFTRSQIKDESVLSQQISNMSLHTSDKDAYETLNLTPRKNLSISVLDNESVIFRPNNRLRVIENYQRQFVGDISVLESEVVTLVNSNENIGDWRLIKRGDGQQGYIPEHIVVLDRNFT
ncbi:unnamed protein product [Rotaria sp. Silwood1]|nr:unnamed protein product [Rotaria sp. Silwood1]